MSNLDEQNAAAELLKPFASLCALKEHVNHEKQMTTRDGGYSYKIASFGTRTADLISTSHGNSASLFST